MIARSRHPRARRATVIFAALVAIVVGVLAATGGAVARSPQTVTVQFLDISDWHGQLDPVNVSNVNIGGAPALSTYFKAERAKVPNTITLTAGDDFGATPPLAGFFEEKPAVIAQRLLGIDVGTFGNNNF